jgi:hypothetical protein
VQETCSPPALVHSCSLPADLVMLDMKYRIEAIATQYPKAHILMSADVSSIANTGFVIVRNTQWARRFLQRWLAFYDVAATEQLGFERVYQSWDAQERSEKIAILPPELMNSIAAPMGQQQEHHKVRNAPVQSLILIVALLVEYQYP